MFWFTNGLLVFGSMVLLWKGADAVVDSSVRIARRYRVSELVIGLTLVSLGTSAPEFAVSIGAALRGQANISVGNVVGSNVFNLGFILGGCAAIGSIAANRALVYRDGLFLIGATVLLSFLIGDFSLSRIEGTLLVAALFLYVGLLFWRRSVPEREELSEEVNESARSHSVFRHGAVFALGLVAVLLGAHLLVHGASAMARALGWSQWAIGVTIVAAGTSAPELVTTLNAVLKGRHGISAGGLIGSDVYNLLGVLGVAAVIQPLDVDPSAKSSVLVLVGMVGLAVVFMRTGWRISRTEGLVLLTINGVRWWAEINGTMTIFPF